VALQDYLVENAGAYDIEVMHWWSARPIVYANATVMQNQAFIDTLFPTRNPILSSTDGTIDATVTCFGNGSEELDDLERESAYLLNETGNRVKKLGIRITQNGLGYDNKVLDKKEGIYLPGNDNSRPKTLPFRPNVMGTKKGSRDGIDFDLMWWARSYLLPLMNDTKIETTASFLDKQVNLGLDFMKIINYSEHDRNVELARNGDLDASETLCKYNLDDSLVELKVGQWAMPLMFNIAKICQVPYFSAFNDSPTNVARMYSEKVRFSSLHTPKKPTRLDNDFNETEAITKTMKSAVDWTHKPGFKKDILVAYYPFAVNFEEILKLDEQKSQMLELARDTTCPVQSYIYNRVLEGWCGEIIEDLKNYKNDNLPEAVLLGKYGKRYDQMKMKIVENLETKTKSAFVDGKIVNQYRTIYFLEDITEEQAKEKGFIPFGRADVMSIDEGRVIYKMNGEILSSGISVPSRKKRAEEPGRNQQSAFEIMLQRDFAEKYFGNPEEAYDFATEQIKNLKTGKVEPEDLLMRLVKRNNPKDIPFSQQNTRRGKILHAYPELELDESIIYSLISVNDQESYMRYNPEDPVFVAEPAISIYQEKLFGKESKMHKVISAMLSGENKPLKRGESLVERLL
jgi:hypothetical protein